jgi:hypothetical protein
VGKGRKVALGSVPVAGDSGRFRFITAESPRRVEIDEDNVLATTER